MTVCAHVSQRATWPPSAAVRQRSIADTPGPIKETRSSDTTALLPLRSTPSCAAPLSMPASKLTVPWRLYSCSRAKVAWAPGSGGKSGAVVAIAWYPASRRKR